MRFSVLILGILIGILSVSSCQKKETTIVHPIVGTWVQFDVHDYKVYEKTDHLDDNHGGMIFYENGDLVMRENAGFCGTPPITYGNFEGKWELLDDTHIQLTYDNWDGEKSYKMEIISLDDTSLEWDYVP